MLTGTLNHMANEQSKQHFQVEVPPPEEVSEATDQQAKAEEEAVASSQPAPTWEEWAKGEQLKRSEGFKDTLAYVARASVVAFALLIFAAFGIWLFHMIAPTSWRWLADPRIDELQTILFSGAVSAFATGVAKNVVQRNN